MNMNEDIKQQFEEMGVEPTADVIAKSMELCIDYHITDAVELVEQWIAFSISNLQGAEPTVDSLREFERKVLQPTKKELSGNNKRSNSNSNKLPTAKGNLSHLNAVKVESKPLTIYGITKDKADDIAFNDSVEAMDVEGAVLDTYNVYHTPKAKSALARTPARLASAGADARFSPASYSPIAGGTPRSHQSSSSSGKIIVTFGNPMIINKAQWCAEQYPHMQVKQLLLHNELPLNKSTQYMYDSIPDKCDLMAERIYNIGRALCRNQFGNEQFDLVNVDHHSQETVKTVGMIYCEHGGPLDNTSTILMGSDLHPVRTVRLNFSRAKSVALFPGQVVMVSGINPRGDTFLVEHILNECNVPAPVAPRCADSLNFVVAAGPYTHDDDLVYEPLSDLMEYLKTQRPNLLILTGPFLDAEHKLIGEETTNLAESFDSFFEKMMSNIVDIVGTSTTILAVSSHRDANADAVYPTMPMTLKKSYTNVHLLPDPSLVDINGITVGITSTDVVTHIINNELALNAGDKVKRVVNHLFNQASFYPLHPPQEDKVCLDSTLAHHYAKLDKIPNVLILPSDQKPFIRAVNNCLVINPGRVSEKVGGSFARFIIKPPAPKDEANVLNYVGCQVRRI